MNLISIIIPVHNKEEFVWQTVDSALNQTYPNTEVVLINDGSKDRSLEILKEFQIKYPDRVTLIDSANRGVSAATNLGIQASRGEYIQFLDADDLISPDKINTQISLLKGKVEQSLATCSYVGFKGSIQNNNKVPYGAFRSFESGFELLLQFWERQEMLQPACYLTHKSLIEKVGPWDENLTINQDGEFFMRVLLQAKEIIFDSESLVYYRNPGQSNVSQQKSKKAFSSLLDSYQSYETNSLAIEDSNRVRTALKMVYQKFIYDCFPNYPELLSKAEELLEGLGVNDRTFIGGPKFQILSKYLGFKNALRLKRFLK